MSSFRFMFYAGSGSTAAGICAYGLSSQDPLMAGVSGFVATTAVIADFAARIAYARKHVPRHQLAAAIAAINAMRKAALATINRNAAMELAAKRRLVQMRRKRPLPRKSNHVPPANG
jgi:hypothetical protein